MYTPRVNEPGRTIPWRDAVRAWAYVALHSFGGPAGQIAVMHRVFVDERRWLSERQFLHALNYCMLLPGPEAMQLATYTGWLTHGVRGGLTAGLLFVLPGFVSILVLSVAYAASQGAGPVEAIFLGIKPAVIAIVMQAMIRIGARVLDNALMLSIAAAAFLAVFLYKIPFPVIIVLAALIGWAGAKRRPDLFQPKASATYRPPAGPVDAGAFTHPRPSLLAALRTTVIWLAVWLLPVAALALALGHQNVFARQALFFSGTAVVTFGGAYAVLSYVAQQAVEVYGWLQPGEMLDGLGLAESTPGPLIQVVQFVGFMGAARAESALHPLIAGSLASVVVTWVTFAPCFLWIFVGAPFVEALRRNESLNAALSAITASVVGVILNLAVWFAVHTCFTDVGELAFAGARIPAPDLQSANPAAIAITIIALLMVFALRWSVLRVIGVCAAIGLFLHIGGLV